MKQLLTQPFAWISNIGFYSRMKFPKKDFPEFDVEPTILKIKKCLVWNPNIYHKESKNVDDKE